MAQESPARAPARPVAATVIEPPPRRDDHQGRAARQPGAAWPPVYLTSFIGREREAVEIRRLLAATRLLTLAGVGGVGKTRLAQHIVASDPGGISPVAGWVDLAPSRDQALVPQIVATALGLAERRGQPLAATLAAAVGERPMVLVLDNCEHLAEACAALAVDLLRACPSLRLLTTSRRPLGVAGEAVWRVGSLAVAEPRALPPLAQLARVETIRLFVERARLARPGFSLTAQNAPALAAICARLDGLPLAIELAAARLNALSVEQVADRLDDRFRLLTAGCRTVAPRQRTLQATIDWSYSLLRPVERALFARLAVFAGSFTLEAAEAVAAGAGIDGADILDLLAALVDHSLVVVEEARPRRHGAAASAAPIPARYRLLETLRQYAWERLVAGGEAEAVRDRHAVAYLALAEAAAPCRRGQAPAPWLDRLEEEHDNLRAALGWADERGAVELGLRLGGALYRFWWTRGHLSEGRRWLAAALARAGPDPAATPHARAVALNGAGVLAREQGDYEAARALFEASLTIVERLGDRRSIANARHNLGGLAAYQGDEPAARALFADSLAIWREVGDRQGVAWALRALGHLALLRADDAAAASLLAESLTLARELDNWRDQADALCILGALAIRRGEHAAARAHLTESLTLVAGLEDRAHLPIVCRGLAALAAAEGRPAHALRLAGAAAALGEAAGARLPPGLHAGCERLLLAARRALGAARATAAWEAGRAMTAEQVIAAARGGPIEPVLARRGAAPMVDLAEELTRREREVAALVARGLTNRQIAAELAIGKRTVDTHVLNLLGKLGVASRAQIAAWTVERGALTGA